MRYGLVVTSTVLAVLIVVSVVPRPAQAWAASLKFAPKEVGQGTTPTFNLTVYNDGATGMDIYYVYAHFCWLDPGYAYYFKANDGTTDSVAWLSSITYSLPISLPQSFYGHCPVEITVKAQGHLDFSPYSVTYYGSITVDPTTPLRVSITASHSAVTPGTPVAFTSSVSGGSAPYAYQWSFGDGTRSTEANTSHAYASQGVYEVVLVVQDFMGTKVSAKGQISVVALPAQAPAPGQTLVVPVSFGIQRLTLINDTLAFSATCNITVSMESIKVQDGRTGQTYLDVGPGPCTVTLYIFNVSLTVPILIATPLGTAYSVKIPGVSGLTAGLVDVYLDLTVNLTATYEDMGLGLGTDRPTIQWDHWGPDDLVPINITADVGGTGDTKLFPAPYDIDATLGLGVSVKLLDVLQFPPWDFANLDFPGTPPVAIPVAVDLPPSPVAIAGAWAPGPYSLQVNWTPTHDNDFAAYDLRIRGPSTDYTTTIRDRSQSTLTLPAAPGTTYSMDLWAVDGAGQVSRMSSHTVATPHLPPPLQLAVSAAPASGIAPLPVAFSARPTGGLAPYAYAWDFGDGTSSTVADPSHTYEAPGTYRVTLVVQDSLGTRTSSEFTVGASGSLEGTAASDGREGPAPLVVSFSGTATGGDGPYIYEWDFGDGGTSVEQNPMHTYRSPGAYTVTLTVKDALGRASTTTVQVAAQTPPPAAFPQYAFLATMPRTVLYLSNLVLLVGFVVSVLALRRRKRHS